MLKPVYEVTMKCKNPDSLVVAIVVRTKGVLDDQARKIAKDITGDGYELNYIMKMASEE